MKGTIHWVAETGAFRAEVRLYDRLFTVANPEKQEDWKASFNKESIEVLHDCMLEPSLREAGAGIPYQFERLGYFAADPIDQKAGKPVFNRSVTLKDTWAKVSK